MKKVNMKEQFSALVKVGSKMSMFSRAADSKELLVQLLEKHGLGVANIVTIKSFSVLEEKQRGRTKSKY